MRDEFFEPSFGNRPRDLVGRDRYLKGFEGSLDTTPGSRERATLILGQRGYGKTVLLLEMADIAKHHGYVVASPTVVSKEMPERIIEKLYQSGEEFLKKEKPRLTGGNVSVLGFGAGFQIQGKQEGDGSFALRLSKLCHESNEKGHGVLILIDEVLANSEELKQLIIAYQEIVGEGGNIAIAMAGLPGAVSSTLNDHVLTFLNRAKKMELSPLDIGTVYGYYRDMFDQAGISITDEKCRTAAACTAGSAYMMQLVGHYIVTYSDKEGAISDDGYESALKDARVDFVNDIGKTTLSALSDRDIDFLKAMAEDEGDSTISDIGERMGVSSAYVQLYKKRLIGSGVIEQPRRGKVSFAVAYLKDYLKEYDL